MKNFIVTIKILPRSMQWIFPCYRETVQHSKSRIVRQLTQIFDNSLVLVKELMTGAASIEEFADSDRAKAAGLFCKDGGLFLQFSVCPCPMLADVGRILRTFKIKKCGGNRQWQNHYLRN